MNLPIAFATIALCLISITTAQDFEPISSEISNPALSMDDQCKFRLNDPDAFIEERLIVNEKSNCQQMRCVSPQKDGWRVFTLQPADNTPCSNGNGGQFFRGRCREQGNRLMNVGTGQCAFTDNPSRFTVQLRMEPCYNPGTLFERFVSYDEANGKRLATPWASADGKEIGERCAYTGNAEGGGIWTDRCSKDNPWHGWDFHQLGNDEFLLKHRVTGRCARAQGSGIGTYTSCNSNDRNMRWKFT